ncbi:MAG: hypothetical protein LBG19_03375 [Prevotellaceae bacterium]|jgi:cell fate regulator YaaT (PSP1 superfamily)|nr:hypothetical protein [Prevotellaceae bacterium]
MSIDKNNILYDTRSRKVHRDEQGELKATSVKGCHKLDVYNWLQNIPADASYDIYEVKFKNTRKGYFKNVNNLNLKVGDIVAVESSPGHDTGIISLDGPLVNLQIKRHNIDTSRYEFRRIYRKAKSADIEKWQEAVSLEHTTMIKSRQIVTRMGLNMKIGDVEYQGDRTKAIFYYIADERVDFRELIKVLAEEFKIRIEMKQIGARQEAGLIGGIGPCGRELCCAQWMCNFVSVTTSAARHQDISLNPQKLAGQCSKLKCCLNFEVDTYIDAQKKMPHINAPLDTVNGPLYHIKTDILKKLMWFSYDKDMPVNLVVFSADRVRELIKLNKKNIKIENMESISENIERPDSDFKSAVGEDSITRFDEKKKRKKKSRSNNRRNDKKTEAKETNDNNNGAQQQEKEKKNNQQNGKKDGGSPLNHHRRHYNKPKEKRNDEGAK